MSVAQEVKVYNNGSLIELPRERCIFTQRSAIVQACPRKRWLLYHGGPEGKGLDGALRPDDLELGSSVHKGMEELLGTSSTPWEAGYHAYGNFVLKENLLLADDPWLGETVPEVAQEVKVEQGMLALALVYAFGVRHQKQFEEQYEGVSLEEEINWLLGETEDSRYLVMMSRPDGVVRGKKDGRLYVVSYKTVKKFWPDTIEKLGIDPQAVTEGLAVEARYGEEVAGTLYFYFVKGERKKDGNGFKRYESGLMRPFMDQQAVGGTPSPSNFAMVGKWSGREGEKGGALGRGWERVDVWEYVEFEKWLEWLDRGWVQPGLGRDWLGEAVAEPLVEVWDKARAVEWVEAHQYSEELWNVRVEFCRGDTEGHLAREFPKVESQCFNFTKRCQFFGPCWEGEPLDAGIASGRWKSREVNHEAEREEE
jgi:hypothetical protein